MCVLHDKVHYFKRDDENQVRLTSLIGATTSDTLISNTHKLVDRECVCVCVCVCVCMLDQ